MLSFAAPAWLAGLLLAPVIRWLHRGGRPRLALPVARAALWRAAPAAPAAEAARLPPDPAWRRRAALAAVLVAALAGPQWPATPMRLTLWVDDSPSMMTREVNGTRLDLGLAEAGRALQALPGAEVELRFLSEPWRRLPWGAAGPAASAAASQQPPPAALLRPERQHWLLTDGAHPALQAWPGGQAPARLLHVGSVRRNVGLVRVAARRPAGDAAGVELLVELANGGDAEEVREIVVSGEGGAPLRATRRLAPGASARWLLSLPPAAASGTLRVQLLPADALPEDDEARLALGAFAAWPVQVDAGCPAVLRAAVAAHPGMQLQAGPAGLRVACGAATVAGPALRWQADRLAVPVAGALQWSASRAASPPPLDAGRLQQVADLTAQPGDAVLLAATGRPLLLARAGAAPVLDIALDAAALGPDLPLLLDFAATQALGRPLLDPVAVQARPAEAVRVVPLAAPPVAASGAAPAAAEPLRADRSAPLLLAAVLLLMWELLALARRWRDAAPAATGALR